MGKIKDLLRKWLYPVVGPEVKPIEIKTTLCELQRYELNYAISKENQDNAPSELVTHWIERSFSEQIAENIMKNVESEYDPKVRVYHYRAAFWLKK